MARNSLVHEDNFPVVIGHAGQTPGNSSPYPPTGIRRRLTRWTSTADGNTSTSGGMVAITSGQNKREICREERGGGGGKRVFSV